MSPYQRHIPPGAASELERLDEALVVYRAESDRLALEFAEQVSACLRAGATWGEIGDRIGMTKQGARAHWAQVVGQEGSREPARDDQQTDA